MADTLQISANSFGVVTLSEAAIWDPPKLVAAPNEYCGWCQGCEQCGDREGLRAAS